MVERTADLLIHWRKGLLALFVLLTLALGYSATHTQLDPGFNKQIPVRNAYMVNFPQFQPVLHRRQPLFGQREAGRVRAISTTASTLTP
jgi:predicted RND superfamily exporter protein